MPLLTIPYSEQIQQLPATGQQIITQYDTDSIIVYQAYRPAIGHFAAKHGYFGGEFSLNRMSWIKPNFLWMMFRSGWGTKPDQEVTLAIRLKRSAFDELLSLAVHSSFSPSIYEDESTWKTAVAQSDVRLQWDPDHHPSGAKLERRAIQLGMRGQVLKKYAREWLISIEDISEFVHEQRQFVQQRQYDKLSVPAETIYPVTKTEVIQRIGITSDSH